MNAAMPFATEDRRWRAIAERDSSAEGAFVYAVRTTGIYCRPGCASRRPNRENVTFFERPETAERAGYRPCKRCRPDAASPREQRRALVARACRYLEVAEKAPTLAALATEAGLSPWHFQRLFKSETGVTPRQYFADVRARRFRERLREDGSVTDAIHGSGYEASSQAYADARRELAMTPTAFRNGAAGEHVRCGVAACSLGIIAVATTARGICAIEIADDEAAACAQVRRTFPCARIETAGAELDALLAQVVAFIESPGRGLDLPLDIRGTAFRRRVWQALREIPPGETVTYAELAARIGRPGSARAVAGACAANRLAVALPCHRVIRADGGLGGYRWGADRKRALLERES
ncbi:MAG: bifunctional DNA-binding transcriptional regulator/O6-methylguanine-DNA methyltransferase Ada [Halofilum sp. (in: g-proteobacteria)]|nr:bifunctional DNA-binding transcriptional regulator/O6-methylguanine-DNA methyltransferase Ada [Halofilum sp. (in: g-proteobacteria)]